MKFKILAVFVITNLMFVSSIFSQTTFEFWESHSQLPVTVNTLAYFSPGYPDRFQYQIAYDNYGVNMITINVNDQSKLNYYLLDNHGNILEQTLSIDQNIQGATICSYNGKVYIISLKSRTFNIYEKINGVNQFSTTPKYSFTPANYNTSMTSDPYVNIEAVGLNDHIFFTWDRAYYSNGGAIGLARYSIANNNGAGFAPIDGNMHYAIPTGNGNIVASPGKLHVVFSWFDVNNPNEYFLIRDIEVDENGNVTFLDPESAGHWNGHFDRNKYGALVYSESTNELFLFTQLQSHSITVNYKYKKKSLGGMWPHDPEVVWDHHAAYQYADENQKKPAVFFNNIIRKVGFQFSVLELDGQNRTTYANIRQYDLNEMDLGERENLFHFSGSVIDEWFRGSSASSSVKGDFLIYCRYQTNSTEYFKIRRPKPFYGDITNNSLLTGNEYINGNNLPHAHANGAKIIGLNNSHTRVLANTDFYIDAGGSLTLNSGATLELGSNCNLIVENPGSLLDLKPGSSLTIGNGAKIIVRNGGRIVADQISFSSAGSWQGIELTNSGGAAFTNCSFSNFNGSAVNIQNNASTAYSNFLFYNNDFHISTSGSKGISAKNIFNFAADLNRFHFTNSNGTVGIMTQNYFNAGPVSESSEGGEGGEASSFSNLSLSITNNNFNGNANIGMFLGSYASQQTPFNILRNTFTNNNTGHPFVARMITGNIKQNHINVSSPNANGMWLLYSNVNMFGNYVSNNSNVGLFSSLSYPRMAPLRINGQLVWYGGRNLLKSGNNETVRTSLGYPQVDFGNNTFEKSSSFSYHFFGNIDNQPPPLSLQTQFPARNNCWDGGSANIYLWTTDPSQPVSYTITSNIVCPISSAYDDMDIIDLGEGIYDTLYYSNDNLSDPIDEDELLYSTGNDDLHNSVFTNAMSSYKALIDNFEESHYVGPSLYELELCYNGLDTTEVQEVRDILYSHFKNYLVLKFEQYAASDEISDIIYNLILRCDVILKKYQEALDGYEFIALYHPDAAVRLNASYDYSALEEIVGPLGGGAVSSNMELEVKRQESRMEKKVASDPRMRALKEKYEKTSNPESRKQGDESKINESRAENEKISAIKVDKITEEKLRSRARENIILSRNLSDEEKQKRFIEDITLMSSLSSGSSEKELIGIPSEFMLEQNYPNPFNPSTIISFSIPAASLVKLNVYDLTGRLIKVLSNEIREAGIHNITFDGSGLSSGVYFYKLEADNFKQTKRMLMIK